MKSMDKVKKPKSKDRKQDDEFSSGITIKDMTDKEVDEEFIKFVEDMNLSSDKKKPLLNKNIAEKRLLLSQTHRTVDISTSRYVHSLEGILEGKIIREKVGPALDSLKVHLTNSPLSLVKEFNNNTNRGLDLLMKVFSMYLEVNDISILCLKCIRAFGNCGYGLYLLISNKELLLHVALCLNYRNPSLMLLAIELLTLFTFYSFESHSNVMEVLYFSSRLRSQEERFMPIVQGLASGINDMQTSLIIPCLQFINVIVSPNFKNVNTCSNLDANYSMHLRIEFVRCGLNTLLDQLLASDPEEVIKQNISVFQCDNDYEEDYISKMDLVKTCLKDRNSVYQMLSQSVSNTDCDAYLTSIMKHLLIIKDDPIRYHLYRLIDDVVAEVIIHSDGMSPDPMLNQLDSYNLTEVFEKFNDMKNMCGSELQEKLDKVMEEKHEAEAKLSALENKYGIKSKISSCISAPLPPGAPPPPGVPPPPMAPPGPPPAGVSCPPPPPGSNSMKVAVMNGIDQSLPFGMQIKTPFKPKVPMKKANWSKVEVKLLEKSCIWKKINDDDMNINEALKELGERFCTKAIKPKELNEDDISMNSYSSLPKKIKEYKVLDAKSGQNLAILSGSLKVPHREIKRRILELDEGLLSQTIVENLLKNLPPIEQLNILKKMNDDYENLNEAEQFGCTLASINCLHSRLNSLLFKMKFSERVSEIKPAIICATEALSEVRNSASLPKILELILYFGNFMNNSSKTSLTVGFHLSFLTKLTGTKDNSDVTLMEFLVTQIKSRYPSLLNVVSELSYLNKASRISTESINSTISEMKSIKNSLDRELKNYKKQAENDNYLEIMQTFLVSVNEQSSLISEMNSKLQQGYKDMAKYFSFDLVKYPMEEFFRDMKQFKDDFYKSLLNIETAAQMDLKRLKAQEEKERREKEKMIREKQKVTATSEEDVGLLDHLLETLNSGDAYGNRMENRVRRKKKEKLHNINRSRSRRDFDRDLIPMKN